jgi:hypothetical protein
MQGKRSGLCFSNLDGIRSGCNLGPSGIFRLHLLRFSMLPFSGKQMVAVVALSALTSFFVVPMINKLFDKAGA